MPGPVTGIVVDLWHGGIHKLMSGSWWEYPNEEFLDVLKNLSFGCIPVLFILLLDGGLMKYWRLRLIQEQMGSAGAMHREPRQVDCSHKHGIQPTA